MKRLQFDMPEDRVEELDKLVKRTGLRTRVQLINAAFTLFEWASREREAGRIIASMDERTGKYKEIEMPGFPEIPRADVLQKDDSRKARVYAAAVELLLKGESPEEIQDYLPVERASDTGEHWILKPDAPANGERYLRTRADENVVVVGTSGNSGTVFRFKSGKLEGYEVELPEEWLAAAAGEEREKKPGKIGREAGSEAR